jgi:hypothetical protein
MDRALLIAKLRLAWDKETSYWPDKWTSDNPALGQCAVTALVVHDHYGGSIKRCMVKFKNSAGEEEEVEHYYNMLPENKREDSTLEQFGKIKEPPPQREVIIRRRHTAALRTAEKARPGTESQALFLFLFLRRSTSLSSQYADSARPSEW